MLRWMSRLLAPVLVLLMAVPAMAADLPPLALPTPMVPAGPLLLNPDLLQLADAEPIPVAFSAVANRYTGVDPATTFDLNGDLVGDLKVSATEVTGQNGAGVQLIDPPVLNLDQVNLVPGAGYTSAAPMQLSRVYLAKLSGGGYAKFMVLQASPKVTIWFHFGSPTESVLEVDGSNSRAVLTWGPLADAVLGYNIYRYQVNDNSYTVTQLNDFAVTETTFTDNTAANRYYIYVVQALKAGGSPGSLTTTAAAFVTHKARSLVIPAEGRQAELDGERVSLPVEPEIRNGLFMIPASALSHTGANVDFSRSTGRLTLSRRLESVTYTVVMNVDNPDYTWNGTTYKTDVPPYEAGNQVMVPLRVVAPVLGLGVTFDSTAMSATIGWYE